MTSATGRTGAGGTRRHRLGRPRRAEAADAILTAARELLAERGYAELRVDDVAARARVAKTTIYRRWPSKTALVVDAIEASFRHLPEHAGPSLRADLERTVTWLVRQINDPVVHGVLVGLSAEAAGDAELATALRERIYDPRRAEVAERLRAAVARGDVRPDTRADLLFNVIAGAVLNRALMTDEPLDEGYVAALVDLVERGIATPPDGTGRPAAGPRVRP